MNPFDSSSDRPSPQRRENLLAHERQRQARAEVLRKLSDELKQLREAVAARKLEAPPAPAPKPSFSAAHISTPMLSIGDLFFPEPEPAPAPAPAPPADDRISKLEEALAQLAASVNGKVDYAPRLEQIEANQTRLRTELRTLESTQSRIQDQIKGFDQLFASLTRDSQKLNTVVDTLANEMRQAQASPTDPALLEQLESFGALKERFAEMEEGFQRVLRAVESLETPAPPADNVSEREATANVLASLTKLVQGMRAAQVERQSQSVG